MLKHVIPIITIVFCGFTTISFADSTCAPGWSGSVLIHGDSLENWTVENDVGSSGTIALSDGIISGQSVQINWDINTGDWVQGKYTFPTPIDLSKSDIFGVSLKGGGYVRTT